MESTHIIIYCVRIHTHGVKKKSTSAAHEGEKVTVGRGEKAQDKKYSAGVKWRVRDRVEF